MIDERQLIRIFRGWEVESSITIRILIGGIRRQVTIPVYDLVPKKIRRRK